MFMEELEDDARLSANLVTYNSAISCYLAETKRRASSCHQESQVPKMKVRKNLMRLFWGLGFALHKPYIQLI